VFWLTVRENTCSPDQNERGLHVVYFMQTSMKSLIHRTRVNHGGKLYVGFVEATSFYVSLIIH